MISHRSAFRNIGVFFVCMMTAPILCAQTNQSNPVSEELTEHSESNDSSPVQNRRKLVEEVIVVGQHSPITIRREMYNTQDLVYETFNQLNNDDQYDMICLKEARIGSQIKYKVCKPQFMMEAISSATEDQMDEGFGAVSVAEMNKKTMRQREIMADLANKHPEFMRLLKKRLALKITYESKTGKKVTTQ